MRAPSVEMVQTLGKYTVASLVVLGCMILIYQGRGDQAQAWTLIGLVVGWIIRDSAATSATSNVVRAVNAGRGRITDTGDRRRSTDQ